MGIILVVLNVLIIYNTKSVCLSVCSSVRLSLKILVTTEPIGFSSSGYIPIGPVVVLSHFLGGWDTPTPPPKKKKIFPPEFFLLTHGAKLQEARGEAASRYIIYVDIMTGEIFSSI